MHSNIWKAYNKAKETPESMRAWKEARSISALLKLCNDFISTSKGITSVHFKGMSYESNKVYDAYEWLLDVRWGIKIKLTSIKPLKFEKLPDSGPILKAERRPEQDKYTIVKLSPRELDLVVRELERSAQYLEEAEQTLMTEVITRIQSVG